MILYSAKSTIDAEGRNAFRITKFADDEVESSYLTDGIQCDCPAGVRPTCRHRQMLPQMIAEGIVNTHWFLDWDTKGGVVDFEGVPRSAYDLEPAGEALQGDLPLEPAAIEPIPPGTYTITEPDETGTSEIVSGEYRGHKVKVPAHTWRRF